MTGLQRRLGLWHATALNTIDMVGIGPFIVMSSVMAAMGGPHCIIAWIVGALLATADAMVWAELGAAFPQAGGSYVFLRKLYGEDRWGRVLSFLFIWQTVFQSSFVVASGAIGFTNYVAYLLPVAVPWGRKGIAMVAILLIVAALYRRIEIVGRTSVVLAVIVIGTLLWVIVTGIVGGDWSYVGELPHHFRLEGLDEAMQSSVYAILGYYNVCHLGAEVRDPERVIPLSMFISIAIVTTLYVGMQLSVLSVVPWHEAKPDQFIVSMTIERVFGHPAAVVATVMVLIVALSSLYSVVLGYSRIPYAAARDGIFFSRLCAAASDEEFPPCIAPCHWWYFHRHCCHLRWVADGCGEHSDVAHSRAICRTSGRLTALPSSLSDAATALSDVVVSATSTSGNCDVVMAVHFSSCYSSCQWSCHTQYWGVSIPVVGLAQSLVPLCK